jgi:acyl-CoA synthetase (AMP-forming)/AMP-acid ligase II
VEVDGRVLRDPGEEALRERIRLAVQDGQRLWPDEVCIVRRGVLPRTSSGKVQRRACRELYLGGALTSAAT